MNWAIKTHLIKHYLLGAIAFISISESCYAEAMVNNSCYSFSQEILKKANVGKDKTSLLQVLSNPTSYCSNSKELENKAIKSFSSWAGKSALYGTVAKACANAELHKNASALLEQALIYAQKSNNTMLTYCWYTQSADSYNKLGDHSKAQELRNRAISFRPQAQDLFHAPQESASLIQVANNQDRIHQLLNEIDNYESHSKKALEIASQIQDILEQQKVIEINNYFEEDCVKQNVDSTYQLKPGEAILYPILFDRRKINFMLRTHNKVVIREANLSKKMLANQVYEFIKKINKGVNTDEKRVAFKEQSAFLYNDILGIFSKQLARINNLIIVPDESLGMLPWTALYDASDEKFVLQKHYAISLTPGLSLLNTSPSNFKSSKVLFAGYAEEGGSDDISDNVINEQKLLKNLFKNNLSTLITGGEKVKALEIDSVEDFTSNNLRWIMSSKSHSVVHLSTHANFQETINNHNSGIKLAKETMSFNNFGKLIKAAALNKNGVDLIYLSACQTAASDIKQSTTSSNFDWKSGLGLTGMAIRSGAASVVGNLINSNTEAADILTSTFYKNLASGKSKARSLQLAQLKVFNELGVVGVDTDPYYWAPVILVGDWH